MTTATTAAGEAIKSHDRQAESEGEMKPEEMTLDQLLDALEIVSQEIERRSDRANEANGAYVEHAAIRAELLARLNAGGSQGKIRPCALGCGGGDEIHDCRLDKGPKLVAEAGASQPLQPRCPKCEAVTVTLVFTGDVEAYDFCHSEECGLNEPTTFPIAQFFRLSAPPAMPLCACVTCGQSQDAAIHTKQINARYHIFEASPQLEQVAREIAEKNCEHFSDDCRPR